MRLSLALAFFCLNLPAGGQQAEQPGPAGKVLLTGGATAQSITITLSKPPEPGDFITVNIPRKQVGIVLVTPRGRRITAANATGAGFDWLQYPNRLPLGSDDAGATAKITFTQTGPAGQYRIELKSAALRTPLPAGAQFTSQMDDYAALVRSASGAQLSAPVPLGRDAVVRLTLPQAETQALFDILVPDAAVHVTLTLPDGQVLNPRQSPVPAVQWDKTEIRQGKDQPGSMLLGTGMIMPHDGTHHIVAFEKAGAGVYVIHASRAMPGTGELRVGFIPLKSIVRAGQSREATLQLPAAGAVKVVVLRKLPFEGFTGDRLELVIRLEGAVGTESPKFDVLVEHRAKLRDLETGTQYAPQGPVESRPVEFTRSADGAYHSWLILSQPGMVRVAVRAAGITAAGKPFTEEAIATDEYIIVKPVVAHFRSLRAQAAGGNGVSKFDRLEVTVELEVIEPGDYAMFFTVRDAAGTALSGESAHASAKLAAGIQTLTVAVPAGRIRNDLRDGPLEIPEIRIWRTHPSSSSAWVEVPTGGAGFRTAAFTRDQWAR